MDIYIYIYIYICVDAVIASFEGCMYMCVSVIISICNWSQASSLYMVIRAEGLTLSFREFKAVV